MSDTEKEKAEKEIIRLFPTNRRRFNQFDSQETVNAQENDEDMLENFAQKCNYSVSNNCPQTRTIKEEIAFYVSSIQRKTQFKEYWTESAEILPKLSSLVKSKSLIPAIQFQANQLLV